MISHVIPVWSATWAVHAQSRDQGLLSCMITVCSAGPDHVTEHALFTWLITQVSRDWDKPGPTCSPSCQSTELWAKRLIFFLISMTKRSVYPKHTAILNEFYQRVEGTPKHTSTVNPAVVPLDFYPRKMNSCSCKNLYTHAYKSFIHNSPNLETQVSFNRWMV